MTVTVTTHTKPIGFSKSDVIDLIQNACTTVGYNAAPLSGLVIGICDWSTAHNAPGNVGGTGYDDTPVDGRGGYIFPRLEGRSTGGWYYDVPSTGGTGTGCSFDIHMEGGNIKEIYVNRPGVGYAIGDTVTIDGTIFNKDDGDITVEVLVATEPVTGNTYEIVWDDENNVWTGTDRNGAISYTSTGSGGQGGTLNVNIQVGDILIIDQGTELDNLHIAYPTPLSYQYGNSIRAFSVGNQVGNPSNGDDHRIKWQPMHGQGGTYNIYKYNYVTYSNITTWTITVTELGTSFQTLASFGGTSTFFDKETPQGATSPYGVLRRVIDGTKKYGKIYTTFHIGGYRNDRMAIGQTNEVMPHGMQWFADGYSTNSGLGLSQGVDPTRFFAIYEAYECGRTDIDISLSPRYAKRADKTGQYDFGGGYIVGAADNSSYTITYCDRNAFNAFSLDLITYQSGIDPNCVVFSFKQPNLSSLDLQDNNFGTFMLHHYNSTLWDYDHVMLVGLTQFDCSNDDVVFRSFLGGNTNSTSSTTNPCQRSAEIPYLIQDGSLTDGNNDTDGFVETRYTSSIAAPGKGHDRTSIRAYTQISNDTVLNENITGSQRYNGIRPSSMDFNAVIKGLPINAMLAPVPYYLPDDFAMIAFKIETPDANIQQGDTITVSASEVYTVITGTYRQTSYTSGILFCARTT